MQPTQIHHQRASLRVCRTHAWSGLASRVRNTPTRCSGSVSVSAPITSRGESIISSLNRRDFRAVHPAMKLLDQYKLARRDAREARSRRCGDRRRLSRAIYNGPPDKSAEGGGRRQRPADGIDPEAMGEAISLASNLLVLRQGPDVWRTHGDSKGVHSSDATHAWRATWPV